MSVAASLHSEPLRIRSASLVPGVALAALVSLAAVALGGLEERMLGRAIIEPLVLAILLGMLVRIVRGERAADVPGIRFVAKDLLELAVCLLGATMDVPRLFASGPALAIGIAVLVAAALACGYLVGRLVGLPNKLAVLVACGNAICGNSAIAAVAPVISAEHEEVAASIALTAVLGVIMVLGLPLLVAPLGLSHYQYGVLAGLTVYAVPQVLAAAFAVSALSGQVATVVKLARVLMLGPVVLFFAARNQPAVDGASVGSTSRRLSLRRLIPWFVGGFIVLATLRSIGAVPDIAANTAKSIASWLTIGAMAALGLSVDVHSVRRVGGRVILAVSGALTVLFVLAMTLIRVLALR
jgi:uncharacterized integral membrane protein (TIGR00698 family)